jgi:hypothetical protein
MSEWNGDAGLRRAREWFLISGARRRVALAFLVGVLLALLALNFLWPVEFQTLLTEEQTVQSLFLTLLSGVILLVSIVVSINSLVVSQELTPIGSQHERVVESWNFRTETARAVEADVAPAAPDEFLQQLIAALDAELDRFGEELDGLEDGDGEVEGDLREYAADTVEYLRRTEDLLSETGYGELDTRLFSPLYDPTAGLEAARQLQRGERVPESLSDSLETVITTLQYFVTAREYFKTIYYKREFSRLSRDLLYSGLPSIVVMTYVVLALDANSFIGRTLAFPDVTLFFSLSYVVALFPFLLLTSYVLRAAVIAERTVTAGAFTIE